jgi:uncharacterized membrane protein YhaH (DUF805 family)
MDWRLFTTDGRITRTHYCLYLLVLWLADVMVGAVASSIAPDGIVYVASAISLGAPVWYAKYCVGMRRAHDAGFRESFVLTMTAFDVVSSVIFTHVSGTLSIETFDMPMIREVVVAFSIAMVALVMMGILSFARPDEDNEWGLDPRG